MAYLILCLLCLGGGVLSAVERATVYLRDGRVITGTVLGDSTANPLWIENRAGSLRAQIRVPREQMEHLVVQPDFQTAALDTLAITARRLGPTADADTWWSWAEEALRYNDAISARHYARGCVERNPMHEAAQRLLGRELVDGAWLTEAEAKRAQGLVFVDGQWLTAAERDAHEAEAKALAKAAERRAADRADARRSIQVTRWQAPIVISQPSSLIYSNITLSRWNRFCFGPYPLLLPRFQSSSMQW